MPLVANGRLVVRAGMLWLMVAALGGCARGTLSWQAAPGAGGEIGKSTRLALVSRSWLPVYPAPGGYVTPQLVNELAGALAARGYQVVVLPEQAESPWRLNDGGLAHRVPAPSAGTEAADAAVQAGAQLLLELDIEYSHRADISAGPDVPFVRPHTTARWRSEIGRISLRITRPQDRTVLATLSLVYEMPRERLQEPVLDILMGLDFLRAGRPSETIELKGKPGEPPAQKKATVAVTRGGKKAPTTSPGDGNRSGSGNPPR